MLASGGFNHLEKYEFVSGKDDIPYMKWNIENVWNHLPDIKPMKSVLNMSIFLKSDCCEFSNPSTWTGRSWSKSQPDKFHRQETARSLMKKPCFWLNLTCALGPGLPFPCAKTWENLSRLAATFFFRETWSNLGVALRAMSWYCTLAKLGGFGVPNCRMHCTH